MQHVALLGQPVGHSVSPAMQEAAFAAVGLPWRYLAFDVPPVTFPDAVSGLRALGFVGANVTVPHKAAAAALADVVEERGRRAGACNTLRFTGGRVEGFNTDVPGFIEAVDAAFGPSTLRDATVLVLGAGGAARSVLLACVEEGARRVHLLNRSLQRARALADDFPDLARLAVAPLDDETFADHLAEADLVIQTTTVGMAPDQAATPVRWPDALPPRLHVFDLIYNPRRTRFLKDAEAGGAKVCDGLGMLVSQGAIAFEHWTGRTAPRDVMRGAAEAAMRARHG
mgnify:CR=1 FL=1